MSYSSEVLADSPVVWYRQGDASGTTMADSSGSGRNATYTNSPTLGVAGALAGDADTAVTYNGTNQYGVVGGTADTALKAIAGAFSVECWVKLSTTTGTRGLLDRYGSGVATVSAWLFYMISAKPRLIIRNSSNTDTVLDAATTLSSGTWYHLVATFDGTNTRIYINGSLDASGTATAAAGFQARTPVLEIARSNVLSAYYAGTLDEVAVYGSALSGARVAAHYTAGTGAVNATASLSLSGSAAASAPASATGSLTLSGSALVGQAATATAHLDLSAAGTAAGSPGATGSLTLSGSASPSLAATATGHLDLSATATAVPLYLTDTSNFVGARRRGGMGSFEVIPPYTAPAVTPPVRVDKSIALPDPVLVDGRPT